MENSITSKQEFKRHQEITRAIDDLIVKDRMHLNAGNKARIKGLVKRLNKE